jgi:hypothetical protein
MHHSATPDHEGHDLTLIAALADGDNPGSDSAAAAALLSKCTTCAELHRDLLAIASATRALPATARAPRDFSLTHEQAHRLRRGSWLRSILRPVASAPSASRPLATALTSAGVAGLLVATLAPALLGGGAASAPSRDMTSGAVQASGGALAPQAAGATAGPAAAGAPSDDGRSLVKVGDSGDSGMEVAAAGAGSPAPTDGALRFDRGAAGTPTEPATAGAPNALLIGSIALLLLGLVMFGLRFAARRLR